MAANQVDEGAKQGDEEGDYIALECVCNLCDCGTHNCANFHFRGRSPLAAHHQPRAMRDEASQAEGEDNKQQDNRCSKMEQGECQCLLAEEERYLAARPNEPTRFKSSDELKGGLTAGCEEDELLHVLVTRPAVASRPRDNIVLEGQMDLRTTFETTYEALARLRLDQWRRHQEALAAAAKQRQPKSQSAEIEESAQVSSVGATNQAVVAGAESDAQVEAAAADDYNDDEPTPNEISASKDTSEQQPPPPPGLSASSANEPRAPVNSFIDPDLSSIIVYDAHLDRLERVGLRKRSKHRPSTTLRPGGLFGDSTSEQPRHKPRDSPAANSVKTQGEFSADGLVAGQHEANDARTINSQGEPMAPPPRALTKRELAMEARNLMYSSQSGRLVYSGENLPVDSKRKCHDNVNMIDHIKEQNIVEKRPPPQQTNNRAGQVSSDSRPTNGYVDENEALMNLKLAQQEEAEAVEELQRLTSSLPEQQQQQQPASHKGSRNSRNEQSRLLRTCQNQHFDIYNNDYATDSYDNAGGGGGPSSGQDNKKPSTRSSPQAKNRLFIESPDFIMTTGKWLEESSSSSQAQQRLVGSVTTQTNDNEQAKSHPLGAAATRTTGDYREEQEDNNRRQLVSTTPCDQCRVLKLNDEGYAYVGSSLGHNYFVEYQQ